MLHSEKRAAVSCTSGRARPSKARLGAGCGLAFTGRGHRVNLERTTVPREYVLLELEFEDLIRRQACYILRLCLQHRSLVLLEKALVS